MPSTFLVVSFSVLVVNESVIVIGLYCKVIKGSGLSHRSCSSLCFVTAAYLDDLLNSGRCEWQLGRQTFQTEILSCLLVQVSKIEVLKTSVQFTSDENQLFAPPMHLCPVLMSWWIQEEIYTRRWWWIRPVGLNCHKFSFYNKFRSAGTKKNGWQTCH